MPTLNASLAAVTPTDGTPTEGVLPVGDGTAGGFGIETPGALGSPGALVGAFMPTEPMEGWPSVASAMRAPTLYLSVRTAKGAPSSYLPRLRKRSSRTPLAEAVLVLLPIKPSDLASSRTSAAVL
jgi:hypothetical protein